MIIFMDKYSIGKRHLTNQKYKDAILNFKKAIKEKGNQNKKYVFTDIGYAYMCLNEPNEALLYLNKAIEIESDFLYANYNKSVVLNQLKQYRENIKTLERMIQIHPEYHGFYHELAVAIYNNEKSIVNWNYQRIIQLCDKYISFKKEVHVGYMLKGQVYCDLERYKEAKQFYNHGLSLSPDMIPLSEKINYLRKKTNIIKDKHTINDLFDEKKVYLSILSSEEKKKESMNQELHSLILEMEKNYQSDQISNVGGWQSPRYINLLDHSVHKNKKLVGSLYQLEITILHNLYQYLRELNMIKKKTPFFNIRQIWANINRNGSENKKHNHGCSTVSGCYYVSTGHTGENNTPLLFYNKENEIRVPSLGKEGSLALWGGDIYHSVPKHIGEAERISVAFNIDVTFK